MSALRLQTDELVQSLVSELRPVPRAAILLRLLAGATAGSALSAVLLILLVGARPDLAAVARSFGFWAKTFYMIATAGISLLVAARLARPGSNPKLLWLLPVPLLIYLPAGISELARTAPSDWLPMLLGHGWQACTWLVLGLSLPIYAGLWWAFRAFAPTRMEAAGAVTGLCASAISAVIYCLHCPTDTAVFALFWYTLAFAIAAILGRAFGRRLLHW